MIGTPDRRSPVHRWIVAALLLVLAAPSLAREPPGPNSRAEATAIIADLRRIVSAHGVERLEAVRIGGIDQWISVRGTDRRNPLLLMIHGGPGYATMPMSWYFQRGWEDYFTVVQWDQRGAGKTHRTNEPASVLPTLTVPRMVADAEELIAWLRREFDKERIFVLGHSWGSVIGLTIAHRHPDWLHAYIGMGQLINGRESERRGWQFAMEQARGAGNEEAVRELQLIAPYAGEGRPIALEDLYVQRKWLNHFGGAVHGRRGFDAEVAGMALAPEYTDADLAALWPGNEASEERLLIQAVSVNFASLTQFGCPLILFNGRHDYNVSASVAAEWFERVSAPAKKLVWFERSAHEMMNEEPGRMLVELVTQARPIAERAGDVAPYGAEGGGPERQ
jgi:pimeloyl-ACP methyl ester carboxylesterase